MDKLKQKPCTVCGCVIATGYPMFKHMEYHLKRDEAELAYDEKGKLIGYRRKVKDNGPLFGKGSDET